jgi:DNA polymerase IV
VTRVVLHADMDAFYASIEQRDRPELRGKPVIVGATSRRGVVAAASYEARAFGVRSAMPGFRARELCPEGIFLASDMAKYVAVSGQVHAVFEEFTPLIEPIALDEAFLDVTGSAHLFGGPLELARALKAKVRERTGLVVSCGVAVNKLVAKIACRLGKPDGLYWVPPEQTRTLLAPLPLRWLWGVGPVTEAALRETGLETLGQLAEADPRALSSTLGDRAAALIALAQGCDERPVEAERAAKSYGEENTFERDIRDREVVTQALTSHAQAVARRLRHDAVQGRTVTVKIKLARARSSVRSRVGGEDGPDYPLLTRSKTMTHATDDGAVLRKVAIALWDAAAISEPVRLLGVSVTQLSATQESQLDLFASDEVVRARKLGPAVDSIRQRFGADAIRQGTGDPQKLTPTLRKKRGE